MFKLHKSVSYFLTSLFFLIFTLGVNAAPIPLMSTWHLKSNGQYSGSSTVRINCPPKTKLIQITLHSADTNGLAVETINNNNFFICNGNSTSCTIDFCQNKGNKNYNYCGADYVYNFGYRFLYDSNRQVKLVSLDSSGVQCFPSSMA